MPKVFEFTEEDHKHKKELEAQYEARKRKRLGIKPGRKPTKEETAAKWERYEQKQKEIWEKAEPVIAESRAARLESMQLEPVPAEDKTVRNLVKEARVAYNLPPIDTNDPVQVETRINEYLDFCEKYDKKPTVVGLANWIGVDRQTISYWRRGRSRKQTVSKVIQRYYSMLEEFMVDQLLGSKFPAGYIFTMKNLFDYQDSTNVVIGPNTQNPEEVSREDLEKYFLDEAKEKKVETTFAEDDNGGL